MPIKPLIPGYTANNQQSQIYPWFGTQSQPNSLNMTNGARVNIIGPGGAGGVVPAAVPLQATAQPLVIYGSAVISINGSSGNQATFAYPFPFPTATDSVVICNGDSASQPNWAPAVHTPTLAGFTVASLSFGSGSAGNARFNWIAWGH